MPGFKCLPKERKETTIIACNDEYPETYDTEYLEKTTDDA